MDLGVLNISQLNFKISISPVEAFNVIKENQNADLVYEELNDLGDGISIGERLMTLSKVYELLWTVM
ncbi:MAG: hypothetical protein JWN30_1119 [Bacilli bacterium]|nr:hypothetical protein [Bacilli bacterium]